MLNVTSRSARQMPVAAGHFPRTTPQSFTDVYSSLTTLERYSLTSNQLDSFKAVNVSFELLFIQLAVLLRCF